MKKRGFTLAEVMIAMALIGVIASLTIPTFVSSSRNKANATKLGTIVTATENAFVSMIASEAVQDLTETPFYSLLSSDMASAMAELNKYLKITYGNSNGQYAIVTTKNGATLNFNFETKNATEAAANSAGFSSLGSIGQVIIDVNGSAKPEKDGRDKFYFLVGDNGTLYPAGGRIYSLIDTSAKLWNTSDANYSCQNGSVTRGCTARLMENSYEVDY